MSVAVSDAALSSAVGSVVALLLWIPKKGLATGPGDMRPLQLPPCCCRLVGAALADIVGPIVEPYLSSRQAAIRGGYCGPNVTAAFRHLAGDDDGTGRCSADQWIGFLGVVGPPLWDYVCTL